MTDFSTSFGLERLQREVLICLHAGINDEIQVQEDYWDPLDEEYANIFQTRYDPVAIERIDSQNFYDGHRPSLIDAPITLFPNVSAMAFQADPGGVGSGTDQAEEFLRRLYIEIMCKSSPAPADLPGYEQQVNRRIQRTTDAALTVLMKNRRLNQTVFPLGITPSVRITEVFAGRIDKGSGDRFLWQGSRIELRSGKLTGWLS